MSDKWLSSRKAAEYSGFTEATLRVARSTGTLCGKPGPRYSKVGRAVRYLKSDLDAWIRGDGEKSGFDRTDEKKTN